MQERGNRVMKLLDKYIGCPLNYILGHLRKKNSLGELPKKPCILLIKTAAIGDSVLLEPIIREIKSLYPDSHITFICSKSNISLVKILPNIDEIFLFQMNNPLSSLFEIKKMKKYDVLLDFAPWARINSIISYFAPAKFKVGFKRKGMYRHYVYDSSVAHRDDLHEIENYRNLLRGADIQPKGYIPTLNIEKNPVLEYEEYIVFHMFPGGSSVLLRSWDSMKWLELGHQLQKRYNCPIVFTGGDEDKLESDHLSSLFNQQGIYAKSVAGLYSLSKTVSLLGQAKLVVSVNTGIMHISAAVNVPLVALHGATSDRRWGPLSKKAIVVKSGERCQPCISLGFESKCRDPKCMENITVEMVLEGIEKLEGEK